jgi:hypothetical protein
LALVAGSHICFNLCFLSTKFKLIIVTGGQRAHWHRCATGSSWQGILNPNIKKLERDLVGKITITIIIPLFTNCHAFHSLRNPLLLVGQFPIVVVPLRCGTGGQNVQNYWFALANAKKHIFGTYAINNHWLR